jgi:hypothetical protein
VAAACKNICRTSELGYSESNSTREAPMIDLKHLELELRQARQARVAAQIASSDVEGMIWEVQHLDEARPRFAFFIAGFDQTPMPMG